MNQCEQKVALEIPNPGVSGGDVVTNLVKDTGLETDYLEKPDGGGTVIFTCSAFKDGKGVFGSCAIEKLAEFGREFPADKCLKRKIQFLNQPPTP